jgi:hypothetical protein
MSQPTNRVVNVEDNARERVETSTSRSSPGHFLFLTSFLSWPTDRDTNVPQSAQRQPSRDQSYFSDGSGPLFNMYVERAEKEDKDLADRWQKDAEGLLIFVRLHISLCTVSVAIMKFIDRIILCCSCSIGRGVHPRLEAKSTGYHRILCRKDLRATR